MCLLPYAPRNIVAEVLLFAALLALECGRQYFGQRGNLCEDGGAVIGSLALTLPAAAVVVYMLLFQSYVLRLEIVLVSVQCVAMALQSIFAIVAVASFAR